MLIFEEVVGPRTGKEADRDPTRRHAVRLTRVEPGLDALYDQPIVEIEWAPEDALPFSLCLSTVGPAPECRLLEDVSVARSNVVLVDHGRTLEEPEQLAGRPGPLRSSGARVRISSRELRRAEVGTVIPGAGAVDLQPAPPTDYRGLTHAGARPAPGCTPDQETHWNQPHSRRHSRNAVECPTRPCRQRNEDPHFVVEVDNRQRAWLRFGDGDMGQAVEPGSALRRRTGSEAGRRATSAPRRSGACSTAAAL